MFRCAGRDTDSNRAARCAGKPHQESASGVLKAFPVVAQIPPRVRRAYRRGLPEAAASSLRRLPLPAPPVAPDSRTCNRGLYTVGKAGVAVVVTVAADQQLGHQRAQGALRRVRPMAVLARGSGPCPGPEHVGRLRQPEPARWSAVFRMRCLIASLAGSMALIVG